MEKKRIAVPLVCHGHSRPVVDLFYSPVTPDGFFLISASKGNYYLVGIRLFSCVNCCLFIVPGNGAFIQVIDYLILRVFIYF